MRKIFLILLMLLLVFPAQAQDTLAQPHRPRVGLVLAGGGARGASFIGVLKYLEECDIPVDYIVGTSMGSVIGCLYALGYTPDEMSEIISSIEWQKVIGNRTDRYYLTNIPRERTSTQILNVPINTLGIFRDGIIQSFLSELPSAYVSNDELDNLLTELCQGYHGDINFEELPIPFACIVTDIVASEEIILNKGNLPKSIRASIAIPGLFSPVVIDGKLMVDGGLTNILPSDVLRNMKNVDYVIGIEFSNEKFFTGDKIPHFSKIFDYFYNYVIHVKREENKKLCDILIKPNTAEFGPLSFTSEAVETLIQRGYEEAENHGDELHQFKAQLDNEAGYTVKRNILPENINRIKGNKILVNSVTVEGPDKDKIKWLKFRSRLKNGTMITSSDIRNSVLFYRGLDNFDGISHSLTKADSTDNAYNLTFHLTPCSSPDMFGWGMRFDTKEGPAILLSYGFHEKRIAGFKLKLKGRISFSPRVNATASYTLFPIMDMNLSYDFWWPYTRLTMNNDDKFSLRTEIHKARAYLSPYQVLNLKSQLGFAYISTSFGQINSPNSQKDTIEMALLNESYFKNNRLFGPYFMINYDNLDRNYFARHGINSTLSGHTYLVIRKEENAFYDISFTFQGYLSVLRERLTIIPQVYSRFLFCDSPLENYQNSIGDETIGRYTEYQLPFIGINSMHQTSNETVILRCDLRYNFYKKHYFSAIYNFIPDHYNKSYSGVGLQYSYDSIFGPIVILTQWSDINNKLSAYMSFGFTF